MSEMCGDVYVVDRETGDLVYMLVHKGDRIVREYADGPSGGADEQDLIMVRRTELEKTGGLALRYYRTCHGSADKRDGPQAADNIQAAPELA